MNELPLDYDPDNYHTSQTQSVYVRLDGLLAASFQTETQHSTTSYVWWASQSQSRSLSTQRHYDIAE